MSPQSTDLLPDLSTLSGRFSHVLKLAGLKPIAAAKKLNLSRSYITRVLNGERTNPGVEFLTKCSVAFGVKAEWLKDGIGPVPNVVRAQEDVAQATYEQHRKRYHLDQLPLPDLEDAVGKMVERLNDRGVSPEEKLKALDNIELITEEWRHRLELENRERTTETRAKMIVADVLPEAQRSGVESDSSQTTPSSSDTSAAPKVPSPANQGPKRIPPKPAPKSPGK